MRVGLLFLSAVMMLAGAAGVVMAAALWKKWALFLIVFLYFHMHVFFDFCPRFALPVFPFILIFCSYAFVCSRELWNSRKLRVEV